MTRQQPFIPATVQIGQGLHGQVRTLDDMSEAEIRAIEARYGMPVLPRSADVAENAADGRGHAGNPGGDGVRAHENAVSVVEAEKQEAT